MMAENGSLKQRKVGSERRGRSKAGRIRGTISWQRKRGSGRGWQEESGKRYTIRGRRA